MADEHLVEEHGSEDVELTDAVVEKDDQPASMQVDIANLTEEELDHIADTAIDALQGILKYFDVGEVMIDEYEGDERELILDITGDNLAVLMGGHGKTLDALQFIVSAITTRVLGFRYLVLYYNLLVFSCCIFVSNFVK